MIKYAAFTIKFILILLLVVIISSCFNESDSQSSCFNESDSQIYEEENDSQNMIYDFSVRNDEQNALRIIAEWKTLQPASSKIEYRELGDTENWRSTRFFDKKVTEHKVIVVALHPASTYVFRPVSNNIVGTEIEFSTKGMPHFLPKTNLVVNSANATVDVIIGGFPKPISTIVAVSKEGKIIWYHEDSDGGDPGDFSVSHADGRLFYNIYGSIKAVDYMGNEEVVLDLSSIGEMSHHDFLITPEGNYMYLTHSTINADNQNWCIDEIVERDTNGNELWRWSSADYSYKLGGLVANNQSYIPGCGYDWTHSNSIDLNTDREGRKFIILSIRNLNRVIKIDYPSGEIIWQLGDGLDFTFDGSEPEDLQWFYGQHSASYYSDISSILLFDNGNLRYEDPTENFSRVVMYELDEENMTAKITWEYDFEDFAQKSGNVKKLLYGDFLITFPYNSTMLYSAFIQANDSGERIWQTDFNFSAPLHTNFLLGNLNISSLYDLYKNNQ